MVEEYDMVSQAEINAKRIEDANKQMSENIRQMQELESRRILGGRTNAGEPTQEKVETAQEYAKRMLRGGQ